MCILQYHLNLIRMVSISIQFNFHHKLFKPVFYYEIKHVVPSSSVESKLRKKNGQFVTHVKPTSGFGLRIMLVHILGQLYNN